MRRKRRAVGFAVAAALTVAAAVTVTQTAMADPAAEIDWKPCKDADGDVECGTIEVPVDYAKPDGKKIKIGLAKRAATNPEARVGSLMVDPGGPGGSGVDMVKGSKIGSKQLQEKFDFIGFDPRGINTSTQIKCDEEQLAAARSVGVPTTKKKFAKLAKANKKLADGCRKLTGPLFDHADNLHTVEDIESARKALGDEKLNFLGYSYGTLMGQQYAEKYPKNIRSMVLDGNMDHSIESPWEFASTETAAVERNFNSFAKWCDETKDCALYGEDTTKVYGELRDAARAGKLKDPENGDPIDFYAFSERASLINESPAWPEVAKDLKVLRDGKGQLKLDGKAKAEPVEYVFQSMFCSDWDVSIKNFGEWRDITDRLAEEYPNTQWSSYVGTLTSCIGDPVKTTNPQAPLEIDGAPPLVMIGNLNDYATVYEWSEVAAEQSGATLITYEGYGHTIYGRGVECVDKPVESYLIDLEVPDSGLSCESQETPGGGDSGRRSGAPGTGPWAGR
ncbi:alpha/beta hydrolase [Stackebrandtia nassauensis]|uniref:TAP domain protein n=1 Tax=Stackebrandtia nassauensis (strain DSM 44728 / CIP 108903 / NRRL B-16338 / NBRC 102104 / LLR-40K-21) TaxID=446470 RepID=D3Q1D7_STANL|nr:alpha/beta hydrolase [Stackebrandtia nassauensis]ADD45717.1 TAP domain protein [Stackebrandtia nassauensis DSM 44728]